MAILHQIELYGIEFSHSIDKAPRDEDFLPHIHDTYELFCLVKGDVDYMVEGNLYKLRAGAVMLMRSSETHKLVVNKSTEYERYVLNFAPSVISRACFSAELLSPYRKRALGEKNMYTPSELSTMPVTYFERMIEESAYINEKVGVLPSLLSLLCDISSAFSKKEENGGELQRDREIINYVNDNLTSDITIEKIAAWAHLSPSQVSRIFKNATGTSVHSYIIAKRLILFNKKVSRGKGVIEACHECGFYDYSSFYRLYKKRFGKAPTE